MVTDARIIFFFLLQLKEENETTKKVTKLFMKWEINLLCSNGLEHHTLIHRFLLTKA